MPRLSVLTTLRHNLACEPLAAKHAAAPIARALRAAAVGDLGTVRLPAGEVLAFAYPAGG